MIVFKGNLDRAGDANEITKGFNNCYSINYVVVFTYFKRRLAHDDDPGKNQCLC